MVKMFLKPLNLRYLSWNARPFSFSLNKTANVLLNTGSTKSLFSLIEITTKPQNLAFGSRRYQSTLSNSNTKTKAQEKWDEIAKTPEHKYQELIQSNVFTNEQIKESEKARMVSLGRLKKLPKAIIPYAELMRLDKPVGTWLLYIPCTWSILIAAIMQSSALGLTVYMLSVFGIGSLIMRGAGCTINDMCDKNLDDKVIRSIQRPIASGRVSTPQATAFLAAQTAIGVGILATLPAQCWWFGLVSLPIVFAYPLFKRFTYYPQAALSSCFNWGALLGFPAMGLMPWSVILPLYGSTFIWCMIYDTIYAHQDKKFDINAGIKSTALKWGDKTKSIFNGLSAAQMGLMTLSCYNAGILMGPGVLVGLGIFGYRLLQMIRKVDLNNPADCWKWFQSNIKSGLLFTVALILDYLWVLFF